MALTDKAIRAAKPADKPYKMTDGEGMYLLVQPGGTRAWYLKYRADKKERKLPLGIYPDVSLLEARDKRYEAKKLIREGKDPEAVNTRKPSAEGVVTFEDVATQWVELRSPLWTERHKKKVCSNLEANVYPHIGHMALDDVTPRDVLAAIREMESRGVTDGTRNALSYVRSIYEYAAIEYNTPNNPAASLRGALKPHVRQNLARLTEKELPEFLKDMDKLHARDTTKYAMRFLLLTVVRTKEMRHARWEDFDLENKKEWRIPAADMKSRREHVVPLSKQVIVLLKELQQITGTFQWVFPNYQRPRQAMSENAVLYAIYRMGYKGRVTGHGFRGMMSTILNENEWNRDWIEVQLAHVPDGVRADYNHATYLPQRREMMQWWADYLDEMKGA